MTDAEEIFLEIADLAPDEQQAVLRGRRLKPEVLAEVESLLRHDGGSESFLRDVVERAAVGAGQILAPERIGPWRLGERIGRGGMGEVFRGDREDPEFTQRVAIKLLNQVVPGHTRRLLRERKILARLSHGNIARLYDGGVTGEGHPYLVLEYVEGEAIDRYVERQRLDERRRLELFRAVAEAVEYAHRQLVVHRDIKPSNVLVTPEGTPKLLDFGIAKTLEDEDGRGVTQALTLDYAPPEQVRGEPATPQVDVYALGALLHKILTGRTPFELEGLPLDQAVERLMHAEVSGMEGLPRDLSRILSKALAKEPARRYGSVEMLRADVERFLRKEPVEARGGGGMYRLWRFAQRRWVVVASLAAIFSAVVVALVVSRHALQETERQRQEAVRAQLVAEREHARAEQLASEARAQRDLAEERARALGAQIARADENLATARNNASAITRLLDQQFVSGGMRQAIAAVDEWLKVQRNVVEKNPANEEAVKLLGILEGRRCAFTSPENVQAAQEYCQRSVKYLTPLEGGSQGDDWLRTSLASSRTMLGRQKAMGGAIQDGLKELELASRTLAPAIAGNPSDPTLLALRPTLGMTRAEVLVKAGRPSEAAAGFASALAELRRVSGGATNRPLHLQLATASARLAKTLEATDAGQARRLYRESIAVYRRLAQAPQSQMLDWNEYANAMNECPFAELRNVEEAILYAQKAVDATKGRNPSALDTLAWALYRAGRAVQALETQKKAIGLVPQNAGQFRGMLEKGLREFEKAVQ